MCMAKEALVMMGPSGQIVKTMEGECRMNALRVLERWPLQEREGLNGVPIISRVRNGRNDTTSHITECQRGHCVGYSGGKRVYKTLPTNAEKRLNEVELMETTRRRKGTVVSQGTHPVPEVVDVQEKAAVQLSCSCIEYSFTLFHPRRPQMRFSNGKTLLRAPSQFWISKTSC